ncbi:MAG: sulfur carrier protein ThiS [Myxococcales bacterium]|nr:sulfur carrier protein ThiS [Myxococcales bacterium]
MTKPTSDSIEIKVNGQSQTLAPGSTIADLLTVLAIDVTRIAVEHNRQVIRRAHHSTTLLNAADDVEIVTFVGGG